MTQPQTDNRLAARIKKLLGFNRISAEEYVRLQDETAPPPKLSIAFAESRQIILAGLIIVGLFFGIGGLWAVFTEISGAVIAPGTVKVDTERKTVQHLEGGIVSRILVRNGDQVTAGQPLMILDNTRVFAATDQLGLQLAAVQIDDARLDAEKDLAAEPRWPQRNPLVPAEKFDELLTAAKKVFAANRQALRSQLALLENQISQLREQEVSLKGQLVAEQRIISALQEELDAKLVLLQERYIDKTQILTLQRALAERQGRQAELEGALAGLRERLAEVQLRRNALESDFRQQASGRQAEVRQRLFDLQQQLLPMQDARQRLTVAAPVSGEVVALQVHSEGGVVAPGQPLMDIVPKESPLVVECRIMVQDITHVFKGQSADVELQAFPRNTTPKISGQVVYISADRIAEQTALGENSAYLVHVELDKAELAANNLYLTAGMPAAVFIRTKPRTVLAYALEPIMENFDRALREN